MRKLRVVLALVLVGGLLAVLPAGTGLAQVVLCFGQPANGTVGTGGNDVLIGGPNADIIDGRGGHDSLCGQGGGDTIRGRSGNDKINGGDGNDTLSGSGGDDEIIGGAGSDQISGGGGHDLIRVNDGEVDTVNCGLGRDTVEADRIDNIAANCENVTFP
jgi:Ca2+-binding RTX toxin-like protein